MFKKVMYSYKPASLEARTFSDTVLPFQTQLQLLSTTQWQEPAIVPFSLLHHVCQPSEFNVTARTAFSGA